MDADVVGLLLSVHPRYARAITNGSKTTELRRRGPRRGIGGPVVIYATAPEQAVVATATLGRVWIAPPTVLWHQVQATAGVPQPDFDNYFEGCPVGYGLDLRAVQPVDAFRLPVRAPQSWCYLRSNKKGHNEVLELVWRNVSDTAASLRDEGSHG